MTRFDASEAEFGRTAKRALLLTGKPQTWLVAEMRQRGVGIDSSGISRLFSGQRWVRLCEAIAIAQILGLDLNALYAVKAEDEPDVTPLMVAEMRALADRWERRA